MKADLESTAVLYVVFNMLAFLSLASVVPFLIKINSGSFTGKPPAKQGTFGKCKITTLTVTELCGQSPGEACNRTQVTATCLVLP